MDNEPESAEPTDDPATDVVAYLRELKPYLAGLHMRLDSFEQAMVEMAHKVMGTTPVEPAPPGPALPAPEMHDPDPGGVIV